MSRNQALTIASASHRIPSLCNVIEYDVIIVTTGTCGETLDEPSHAGWSTSLHASAYSLQAMAPMHFRQPAFVRLVKRKHSVAQ